MLGARGSRLEFVGVRFEGIKARWKIGGVGLLDDIR